MKFITRKYRAFCENIAVAIEAIALATLLAPITLPPAALAQQMGPAQPAADASPTRGMSFATPLLVSLRAIPAYGPAPLLVGFILSVTDPEDQQIISYIWNFGDGHISTEPPAFAYNTYTTPGNYIATCTMATSDGRTATAFSSVIVTQSQVQGTPAPETTMP